jgi:hypothetical protein
MLADARLHTPTGWQVCSGMGGRIQRNIHPSALMFQVLSAITLSVLIGDEIRVRTLCVTQRCTFLASLAVLTNVREYKKFR